MAGSTNHAAVHSVLMSAPLHPSTPLHLSRLVFHSALRKGVLKTGVAL